MAAVAASATLASGTPLKVMLNQELTTKTSKIGDQFDVTVLEDVMANGTIVIPKGAVGRGEVTFAADKGGFGRAGVMLIALRTLDLGGKSVALDGRYREEGDNRNGATVATWIAVGVFSGFIKGKTGTIPKGRELLARTGEDIVFVPGAPPPPVPQAAPAEPAAAAPASEPPPPSSPPAPTDNAATS